MIPYEKAAHLSEETLRRWLLWALRKDPDEERIKKESMKNKDQILTALVWIGAIG